MAFVVSGGWRARPILRGDAAIGAALMIMSTICFVSMQSLIRQIGGELPPVEVAFFRNLFGFCAIAPIFFRQGFKPLKTSRLRLHALRGALQGVSMMAFFTGVTMVPFAEATSISFSAPLFATILAVIILREKIRIRRISALLFGFVGVLVVLRPGFVEVGVGQGLLLSSSLIWGAAIIVIKRLSISESAATQTAYMGLFMTPITFLPALYVWETPTIDQLGWMALIGIFGTIGHLCFAGAFRRAESSALLPLDFLRLLWASLLGYFLFVEVPDFWVWIGGGLIFTSATYIAFREAQLAKRKGA
ncbi:MAG: DMT family transporter [Rhodospirillales bacterium]|jgi:drug/metabolite transporter (DMT)-like permease